MSEYEEHLREKERKKNAIRELLGRLHQGEAAAALKEEFKDAIHGLVPDEIAKLEGELIEGGVPAADVHKLCDVHLEVFRENLEKTPVAAPPGHPLNTLMEEHRLQMEFTAELKGISNAMAKASDFVDATEQAPDIMRRLQTTVERIKETESHYSREENVLFPYLEKHGITQPPQIMWTEHDNARDIRRSLVELVGEQDGTDFAFFARRLEELAIALAESLESNIYKENNVLFATSMKVIEPAEWKDIRAQFDDLGYCSYTPVPPALELGDAPEAAAGTPSAPTPAPRTPSITAPGAAHGDGTAQRVSDMIEFETGRFTRDELQAMLNTLPIDITFVDRNDRVQYFSESPERIFPRTKAVIGRTVQNCHPQKSLDTVNAILDGFRDGTRTEPAAFWLPMGDMMVYIRYFPIHDASREYIGCLEVTQNIAPIKEIEGQKRLLD